MKTLPRHIFAFVIISTVLLIVDWILGIGCATHVLPLFVFLIFNIPFGAAYVFLESCWKGNRYELGGEIISEITVAAIEFGAIFAQAIVYYILWHIWQRRRARTQ